MTGDLFQVVSVAKTRTGRFLGMPVTRVLITMRA